MTLTRPAYGGLDFQSHATMPMVGSGWDWLPTLGYITAPNDAAWPTANKAIFVPFPVFDRRVVSKLYVCTSGTAAATGNVDVGVYDSSGTRLVSAGSTAKVSAYDDQTFDVTDTTLGPGTYYIAVACDNTTDTFYAASPTAPTVTALGIFSQTSAFPLPATATMAIDNPLTRVPIAGVLYNTVVS